MKNRMVLALMLENRTELSSIQGTNPDNLLFSQRKAGWVNVAILMQWKTPSQVENHNVTAFKKSP